MARSRRVDCRACQGDGVFIDEDDTEHPCEDCDGTGSVWLDDDGYEPDPDAEDMTPYKDNVLGD